MDKPIALVLAGLLLSACEASKAVNAEEVIPAVADSSIQTLIQADVYVDNWFALYEQDELVKEDSVRFKTERSFNAESFKFSTAVPAQMAIIMKDYYEDDSGLEYIGRRRQQMGDGGLVAQFFDASTGALLAVSDDSWACKVIHQAPLNTLCVRDDNPLQTCQSRIESEPEGWKLGSFDASDWQPATIHSIAAARPHGGYRDVDWHQDAKIIWGEDLEVDNVILCRFTIDYKD